MMPGVAPKLWPEALACNTPCIRLGSTQWNLGNTITLVWRLRTEFPDHVARAFCPPLVTAKSVARVFPNFRDFNF